MRRLYIGIDPTTATVSPPASAPMAAPPSAPSAPASAPEAETVGVTRFYESTLGTVYSLGSLLSAPVLAYHGYKRHNDSILWGLGWWLVPLPWPIMMAIAVAQSVKDGKWKGFGQPLPR